MNHDLARVHRDHITIDLNSSWYWFSIVEERDGDWCMSELAFVHRTRDSLQISCVPLKEWWDESCDEDELQLDWEDTMAWGFRSQADLLVAAFARAKEYISRKKGNK